MRCHAHEHGTARAYYTGCRHNTAEYASMLHWRVDTPNDRDAVRWAGDGFDADHDYVPAAGTRRRLRSLMRMGNTFRAMADQLGVEPLSLMLLVCPNSDVEHVPLRLAVWARRLSQQWEGRWRTGEDADAARAYAAAHDFLSIVAFFEPDDPNSPIVEVPGRRTRGKTPWGRLTDEQRDRVIADSWDLAPTVLGDVWGCGTESINRARRRYLDRHGVPA